MKEKSKKEDTRAISYSQKIYIKRLMRNAPQRTRVEDKIESRALRKKIAEIGVDKLLLKDARGYIATLVEFERLYQEEYENEDEKINNSAKIIDFSKYKKI